ncbi:lipase member H-like isoform X1 [Vanessa cardui]|uniref:lipase member H-like isoform X1 n=1 Tax=Vanessa cardui TaxID=171605 RepID=UPI001F142229|nr:lipase member H-like isoform X1 [Vanessa cardui]
MIALFILKIFLVVNADIINLDSKNGSDVNLINTIFDLFGANEECPGSTKEAFISNSTLKHLRIFVQNSSSSGLRKYNYFQTNELAKDPDIDFKKNTMLYVGGFLDSPIFPLASIMGAAYENSGYNVLLLDTNTFTTVEYPRAARFMRPVGMHTAKMLADLTAQGLDPKKLEIVGLSLGAQTASFIAKNYRILTGMNVSRITALDPAGPCFRNLGPEDRLDKSDADFVEAINTNIDEFGMAAPVGHVNFYVNGGENQPGELFWMLCTSFCSHVRAHTIWTIALRYRDAFVAIQCDSVQQARNKKCFDRRPVVTNVLGLNVNKTNEGIFYLATTNTPPYFLGRKGVRKEHDFYLSLTNSLNEKDVIKM